MKKVIIFTAIIIAFLFIKKVTGISSIPQIQVVQGNCNRVVAAPHDKYELYTGEIAKRIAKVLQWGVVRAENYRDLTAKRWINVNRPTEKFFRNGKRTKAFKTTRSQDVYKNYLQAIKYAAKSSRVDFFVEIHGHKRHNKNLEPVPSIEVTSKNIRYEDLELLAEFYREIVEQQPPQRRFLLLIDYLPTNGLAVKYSAQRTKKIGIFGEKFIVKALHFELPLQLRNSKILREEYIQILIKVLRRFQNIKR